MLTGKCKTDFEKWYSYHIYPDTHHVFGIQEYYNALSTSMQYGVYVDFFDSVGWTIDIQPCCCHTPPMFDVNIRHNQNEIFHDYGDYETRHEARQKAIEKACEIYNERSV